MFVMMIVAHGSLRWTDRKLIYGRTVFVFRQVYVVEAVGWEEGHEWKWSFLKLHIAII